MSAGMNRMKWREKPAGAKRENAVRVTEINIAAVFTSAENGRTPDALAVSNLRVGYRRHLFGVRPHGRFMDTGGRSSPGCRGRGEDVWRAASKTSAQRYLARHSGFAAS